MQWPTQTAFSDGRDRLTFRLLLVNKWFLIPSSVFYEWILSNSPLRSSVYKFIQPTILYTVLSLVFIILLWLTLRKVHEKSTQDWNFRISVICVLSFVLDTVFILYLIILPDSGNILWAIFLPSIALVLLMPKEKWMASWIVNSIAAIPVCLAVYAMMTIQDDLISSNRYLPGDVMICLTGMLFLWINIRNIRTWVNTINQEMGDYAKWHTFWTEMFLRFPPEVFILDNNGEMIIASNSARKLLDLPKSGSGIWLEKSQSIRNALLLRFHAETDIDETIRIPDDSLVNPIKIFPTFFPFEEKKYCIALVQEENPEIPASAGILRSDRLTIAGQIAAGLAHEIGNPLGVIQSCAAYLFQKSPLDDPNREELELIQVETKRCQNMIDRLLSLASPKRDTPAVHDVREILDHSVSLVKYQAGSREIEFTVPTRPVYLFVNEGQISAVFVNLFLNALQSMEDCPLSAKLRVHMRTRGKEAIIDVTDEGMGIAREDLEKIFDPFFTKKASGTGLGLSIVHQIIRSLEGRIDVASVEGAGTTFTVYLPMYEMEDT